MDWIWGIGDGHSWMDSEFSKVNNLSFLNLKHDY